MLMVWPGAPQCVLEDYYKQFAALLQIKYAPSLFLTEVDRCHEKKRTEQIESDRKADNELWTIQVSGE